jgi:hypothetical protein
MRAIRLAKEAESYPLAACIESVLQHYEEKLSHLRDNYSMLEQVYLYGYAYQDSRIMWPQTAGGGGGGEAPNRPPPPSLPCHKLYATVTDSRIRQIIMDDVRDTVQEYQDTIHRIKAKIKTLLAISSNILASYNYNKGM